MLKVIIRSAFVVFLVGATALAANAPKKPTGNSGLASVYSYGRTASGERLIPTNPPAVWSKDGQQFMVITS